MRIVKPTFSILERNEERGGLAIIEMATRTCYKSEDRITEGSAENMVKGLIQKGHEAMLEHGDYIFMLGSKKILSYFCSSLLEIERETGHLIRLDATCEGERPIVSGNIRAWRELMASGNAAAYYFTGAIDPIYINDLIPEAERTEDPNVKRIHYSDLRGAFEKRIHMRQTVKFICDRGVSHEFVRHRLMSFAQESTRYCNYAQDKFNREITVIEPCYLVRETEPWWVWKRQCMSAEVAYFTEMNLGLLPQESRAVLPNSLKTELVMTGTLMNWDHFFDLRARQITGRAHPQAVELAMPLMDEMARRFPDVFGTS